MIALVVVAHTNHSSSPCSWKTHLSANKVQINSGIQERMHSELGSTSGCTWMRTLEFATVLPAAAGRASIALHQNIAAATPTSRRVSSSGAWRTAACHVSGQSTLSGTTTASTDQTRKNSKSQMSKLRQHRRPGSSIWPHYRPLSTPRLLRGVKLLVLDPKLPDLPETHPKRLSTKGASDQGTLKSLVGMTLRS